MCELRSGVGREKFAADPRNSNAALGASGGSRSGTHTIPSEKALEERISSLPEPFKAGARLQQALGLRAQGGSAVKPVSSELGKADPGR